MHYTTYRPGVNVRTVKPGVALLIFLALIAILGVVFFITYGDSILHSSDWTKTTAVITIINYNYDYDYESSSSNHVVFVKYTAKDPSTGLDQEYNTELGSYSSSYYIGKEIKIKYYISNPNRIVDASGVWIFGVAFGVLVVIFIIGTINTIKNKKLQQANVGPQNNNTQGYNQNNNNNNYDPFGSELNNNNQGNNDPFNQTTAGIAAGNIFDENVNSTSYTFDYTTQGAKCYYKLTDNYGNITYEANTIKNSLLASTFEFYNHVTLAKNEHKLSYGSTTTIDGINQTSTFKIDGQDIWVFLKNRGLDIRRNTVGIVATGYEIFKNNNKIATVASVPVGKSMNSGRISFSDYMPNGRFTVQFNESDLNDVFLSLLAIARTENLFTNYTY